MTILNVLWSRLSWSTQQYAIHFYYLWRTPAKRTVYGLRSEVGYSKEEGSDACSNVGVVNRNP